MAKKQERKDYTVSQRKDGKWVVKREGARCAAKVLDTQAEAEAAARELAEAEGVEVVATGR